MIVLECGYLHKKMKDIRPNWLIISDSAVCPHLQCNVISAVSHSMFTQQVHRVNTSSEWEMIKN